LGLSDWVGKLRKKRSGLSDRVGKLRKKRLGLSNPIGKVEKIPANHAVYKKYGDFLCFIKNKRIFASGIKPV
jgi:hypothetical protein